MQYSPSPVAARAVRAELARSDSGDFAPTLAARWRWTQVATRVRRLLQRPSDKGEAAGRSPKSSRRVEILLLLSTLGFVASALAGIVAEAGSDHFLILVFAGAAGAFGATASILGPRRAHAPAPRESITHDEPSWSSLALRVGVGAAAACLFYWLARVGVLGGGPFPALSPQPAPLEAAAVISVADFTKLMLGCFAAGFAERILPFIRPKSAGRS